MRLFMSALMVLKWPNNCEPSFGYSRTAIYSGLFEHKQTFNSYYYCKLLENKVKSAIRIKRRELLIKGIILQNDNAQFEKAKLTRRYASRTWLEGLASFCVQSRFHLVYFLPVQIIQRRLRRKKVRRKRGSQGNCVKLVSPTKLILCQQNSEAIRNIGQVPEFWG